jgi:hypothetical protein
MDDHDHHGSRFAELQLLAPRKLPVPTLSTGRKWWCQPHPGCPAASIPACPGRP